MTNDAADFRRQLGQVLIRTTQRGQRLQQALMLEGLRRVVLRTPVDTGRARGSWQVGAGSPPRSSPIGVDPSGAATIAKGAAVIAQIVLGQIGWIVSNLVYMPALDRGHSRQAPNGIVAVTIQELQVIRDRLVEQAARDEGR